MVDYLGTHGVLVTMCIAGMSSSFLPVGLAENHMAVSWINAEIGTSVIPAESQLGLILKPEAVNMQCIYPTDGASDGRDNSGCGPLSTDPQNGSRGARRMGPLAKWAFRRQMQAYKDINFGPDTDYADIDCLQFLDPFVGGQ